MAHAYK